MIVYKIIYKKYGIRQKGLYFILNTGNNNLTGICNNSKSSKNVILATLL